MTNIGISEIIDISDRETREIQVDLYDSLYNQFEKTETSLGVEYAIAEAEGVLRLRSDPLERSPAIDFLAKQGDEYLVPFFGVERSSRLVQDIQLFS